MEFLDYVRTLRRRWISITLLTLLGVAGAAALALFTTPLYQATTRIFVATQAVDSAVEAFQGSSYTQQRIQSYVDVANSPIVLDPVIASLGLDVTAEELASRVVAEVVPDTVLMTITVSDPSPSAAAEIANAVGESLAGVVVGDLEERVGGEGSLVSLSTVETAEEPLEPSSPNVPFYIIVGGALGLLLGLGFAFLRQALDTRIHGERDVRSITEAPIIGGIAYDPQAAKRPLIVHSDPQSSRAESFRSLRTNLQFIDFESKRRSFVVTSSIQSEGKTTTAVNLAIAIADAGTATVLIDADLRRPKVAEHMGIEGAVGLSDVLIGRVDLSDVLQRWGENGNLYVLPAGRIPPNPSELLGSKSMERLLDTLTAEFGQVIIDAPPLLPVTDAAILSRMTAGALVICAAGRTLVAQLTQSLESLKHVDASVFGIVLNMLPSKGPDAYGYYYGYSYAPTSRKASKKAVKKS